MKPSALQPVSYTTPFYNKFRETLTWALDHRKAVVVAAICTLFPSIGLLTLVKQEFFPASVRPEIVVTMNLPVGTSI